MPLSPDTAMKVPEKKDWPLIPEDVYQVQITDIAEDVSEYQGQKRDVFKFELTIIEDGASYGRKLWKRGSRVSPIPYKNGKNPLTWKVASAVAKHPLTEEEGKAYTIAMMNAMIGKQLRVGVTVSEPKPDGKQYNNADSFFMAKQVLPPFDEAKVPKENQPAAAAIPAPAAAPAQPSKLAQTVHSASGGKFGKSADEADPSEVEMGEIDVEDIPY
jgi:hypothetical protein